MPASTRPHRPERWLADAWLTGSMGSRCTLVRTEYREIRARPASTTYRMPGTVSDVSATFVASTTRRRLCRSNTLCCSADDSRAYSGTTSKPRGTGVPFVAPSFPSTSAVSRISRSPGRNTRMSPGPSSTSSRTASTMASVWSRTSGSPSSSSKDSSTSGR